MSKQVFILAFCLLPFVCAMCNQYDQQTVGNYILYNNLWGMSGASGSQCTYLQTQSGSTVGWDTQWSWSGGNGVKSFANLGLSGINKQLSTISSIPSTWSWSYSFSGDIVCDVAYDIWVSHQSGGSNAFEIMIWLGKYGNANPISSHYDSSGNPIPIASTTIADIPFKLYSGNVSTWGVYSFVSGSQVNTFSADLKLFFNYLTSNHLFGSTLYLTTLQAGTEPTTGTKAIFTVQKYSAEVN